MSDADITVGAAGGDRYRVVVREPDGSTEHLVTATPDQVERLGGGADAGRLLVASFRFLLEREPKESILSRFDLPVIGRYFPEYEAEIGRRLSG